MSTITDAIKKRKKEVGEEGVRQIVPVSLDEPHVEVPKQSGARRIAALAICLLVVGGVAFGALMLFKGLRQGKPERASPAGQVAFLPSGERKGRPSGIGREEALPVPERTGERAGTPPTPGSKVTGAVETPIPRTPEESPAQTGRPAGEASGLADSDALPSAPRESKHAAKGVPSGPPEKPPAKTEPGPPPEVSPGSPGVPAGTQPDPFAGITLQGIIRFDPKTPEVLLNGKTLKVGQYLGEIKVVEIGAESVKLRYRDIEKVIGYQ